MILSITTDIKTNVDDVDDLQISVLEDDRKCTLLVDNQQNITLNKHYVVHTANILEATFLKTLLRTLTLKYKSHSIKCQAR